MYKVHTQLYVVVCGLWSGVYDQRIRLNPERCHAHLLHDHLRTQTVYIRTQLNNSPHLRQS